MQGAKYTGYIAQRSGIITTSAGLLFHAGGDRTVRVYDAETGQVLWTAPLPAGSRGIPAMYEVQGRQFFVVNATATFTATGDLSRAPSQNPDRAYVAFALPAKVASK